MGDYGDEENMINTAWIPLFGSKTMHRVSFHASRLMLTQIRQIFLRILLAWKSYSILLGRARM